MIAKNLARALCALLLFTLTASAQQVYPSRIGNYCQSDLATASASSTYSANYPASSAIDGDRVGQNCSLTGGVAPCWGGNGGWADQTRDIYPDWLRVDFFRAHSIGRVVITTFQDNYSTPRIEPYLGLKVGLYGIEDFKVEVLNMQGVWVTVATVTENEDIIRELKFTPITGTAVRVTITEAYNNFSRIVELEASSV